MNKPSIYQQFFLRTPKRDLELTSLYFFHFYPNCTSLPLIFTPKTARTHFLTISCYWVLQTSTKCKKWIRKAKCDVGNKSFYLLWEFPKN